jgi:hypothetical protein
LSGHHVRMTRPEPVRFLRTEPTMAFPEGRLLAVADPNGGAAVFVLALDGWSPLSAPLPASATVLTREDAEDWCERQGWDLELLDRVPRQVA